MLLQPPSVTLIQALIGRSKAIMTLRSSYYREMRKNRTGIVMSCAETSVISTDGSRNENHISVNYAPTGDRCACRV